MGLLIATGFTTAIDWMGQLGRIQGKLNWFIAICLTTPVALGALGYLLFRSEVRRATALAFAIVLPMSLLTHYLVRATIEWSPIATRLVLVLLPFVLVLSMFSALLTEEPAKWLAAAVPRVRRAIRSQPVTMALVVGLGLAIGEIWLLAHMILFQPFYGGYGFSGAMILQPGYTVHPPWMVFIERLEVCFLHGAFVALPFAAFARGRSFWLGGLAGMVLHFLLNFPILLARLDAFGLGSIAWASVLQLWILGFVVVCTVMTWHLARRPSTETKP
jgi:hypothetical protein